uniref:serine/threonine-protein kinase MARK2-like isoform X3 n=1 Tax=Myxine glutinosa TaxID=7769 RepID=UPI00358FE038
MEETCSVRDVLSEIRSLFPVALKKARSLVFSIQICRVASMMKTLNHPNIIKLIDMPNKDQYVHRLVLVLEYVEGGTLASHLRFLRKLPERMLLFPMKQMADAFEYLHSRNIVHRHIKSHYVLFSNKGTVKVGHFTSAKPFIHGKKFHDNRRRFGDTAPEITQAHGYEGPPVDVWALGILFTELFGGLCFDGRNIIEGFLYGEPSRGCYAHCSCRAAANRTQDPSQISLS